MKKILIIENDSNDYQLIRELCKGLGIEYFPRRDDSFNSMRSLYSRRFAEGNRQDVIEQADDDIMTNIHAFASPESPDGTLYLIAYYLTAAEMFDSKLPKINGIAFYEQFVKDKPAIFMYDPVCAEETAAVEAFCKEHPQCISIAKETMRSDKSTFLALLTLQIKRFFVTKTFDYHPAEK